MVLLLLMGWFLSRFQLMGAVVVTLGAMLLAKVMALSRVRHALHTSCAEFLPWRSLAGTLIASMAATIPSLIVNSRLVLPPLVALPVSGVAYVVTYAALVLMLGVLSKEEIEAVKSAIYVWNRRPVQPARQASMGR
jgi:hypothetical protein